MIKWTKEGKSLIGRVGQVICFYINKDPGCYCLTCDLPQATPQSVGRHVRQFKDPKAAAVYAAKIFTDWRERIEL